MTDILELADRLDACWLDIISPEAEAANLSRCANLIQEASKALRSIGIPRDMAAAPVTDGWILGYDPTRAEYYSAWMAATRCDSGWCDDHENEVNLTAWVPLPEPHPAPTGWSVPSGTIRVEEITGEGWTCNGKPIDVPWRWAVYIEKPDGSYDEYRDTDHVATIEAAEARALKWRGKLGLPIVIVPLDRKVIPLRPAVTRQ